MKIAQMTFLLALLSFSCADKDSNQFQPCQDNGQYFLLDEADLQLGAHHTRHAEIFDKYTNGLNLFILQAIDTVQAHAMDGGGYFVGKDSIPTESPVYYDLELFGRPLIKAPRNKSYCSGATYTAFIEALNLLLSDRGEELSPERFEALRMQEPDGGRREDLVKAWGYWNADGFGSHFSLVQYLTMGDAIQPAQLRPGDFVNISWKSGLGHSVIFLGWAEQDTVKNMLYWSSQRATNGYGDQLVSLAHIKEIKAVRLMRPDHLFKYNPATPVDIQIPGDVIAW
ncbi:hypothetical protein JXO59_02695 [candidate division KSB1 bacterium]|nr:hypothetical protein [candidate division KSB1 bacterium]